MKKCPNCQTNNNDENHYCTNCGHKLDDKAINDSNDKELEAYLDENRMYIGHYGKRSRTLALTAFALFVLFAGLLIGYLYFINHSGEYAEMNQRVGRVDEQTVAENEEFLETNKPPEYPDLDSIEITPVEVTDNWDFSDSHMQTDFSSASADIYEGPEVVIPALDNNVQTSWCPKYYGSMYDLEDIHFYKNDPYSISKVAIRLGYLDDSGQPVKNLDNFSVDLIKGVGSIESGYICTLTDIVPDKTNIFDLSEVAQRSGMNDGYDIEDYIRFVFQDGNQYDSAEEYKNNIYVSEIYLY